MNWSNKWDVPSDVAKIEQASEAQKVHDDAIMYGIGYYNQDGKHVPIEQVYSDSEGEAANEAMKALGVPEIKIDYGSDDKSFETTTQDGKIISQYEIRSIKLGNKTIVVTVVGDLGLDFCEPGEKDTGWNIYHLPTLACFSSAVPFALRVNGWTDLDEKHYEYDKAELLNWMVLVLDIYW